MTVFNSKSESSAVQPGRALHIWRHRSLSCVAALLLPLVWFGGCARWSSETPLNPEPNLPVAKRSLDAVVVETVFVRFSAAKLDELTAIWDSADETILDIATRRRLDANGLRAGMLIGDLPSFVREQLKETSAEQTTNALEHAGLAADVENRMRQMQCRAGRRKELFVRRDLSEPLTILYAREDQVAGETFHQPSLAFDLRATPIEGMQARITLTPEVQHGDMQQSFVSTEFGLRPELRRPRKTWEDLNVQVDLQPGKVLLMAATHPTKSVGGAFFTTETADQAVDHVLMLLRVADTQIDELFAPSTTSVAQTMMER